LQRQGAQTIKAVGIVRDDAGDVIVEEAREIVRVLRPGGAVMGFFCTSAVEHAPFTKFEIVDECSALRHRRHAGAGGPKKVLQNRDVIKIFDGLFVAESFLLKSNTREMLLRKRP
jgi:hypothetical protein